MNNISKKSLKGVSFLVLLMITFAGKNACAMESQLESAAGKTLVAKESGIMTDSQAGDALAKAWDNYGIDESSDRPHYFNFGDMTGREAVEAISDIQIADVSKKSHDRKPTFLGKIGLDKISKNRIITNYDLGFKNLQTHYQEMRRDLEHTIEPVAWRDTRRRLCRRGQAIGYLDFKDEKIGNETRRVITYFDISSDDTDNAVIYINKFIEQARYQGVNEVRVSTDVIRLRKLLLKLGFTLTEVLVSGNQNMSMKVEPLAPTSNEIDLSCRNYDFMHEGKHIGRATYYDRGSSDGNGIRRYISRLDVYDGYRDQGHGTRHMKAFIEKARHEGVTEIALYALARPVPFYRKLGFEGRRQEIGTLPIELPQPKVKREEKLTHQAIAARAFKEVVIPIESAHDNPEFKKLFYVDNSSTHVGLAEILTNPTMQPDIVERDYSEITYDPAGIIFSKEVRDNQALVVDDQRTFYLEEYKQLKENPSYQSLLDKNIHESIRILTRRLENAKSMNAWQRGMSDLLIQVVEGIIVSSNNMPHLHAYVNELCKTQSVTKPIIVIAQNEGFLSRMIQYLFAVTGTIVIGESLLKELPDCELEALIAHEIGYLKYHYIGKRTLANLCSFFAAPVVANGCGLGDWVGLGIIWGLAPKLMGKIYERASDDFVCNEAGNARGLINALKRLQEKAHKEDADFDRLHEAITQSKSQVGALDYTGLHLNYSGVRRLRKLGRFYTWLTYMLPFGEQYDPEERIKNAERYLLPHQ